MRSQKQNNNKENIETMLNLKQKAKENRKKL